MAKRDPINAIGATVLYCGHNATFIADIIEIEGVAVVRANGNINYCLQRPSTNPTHHLVDFPKPGFWRPDIGVFVVPKNQVKKIHEGNRG